MTTATQKKNREAWLNAFVTAARPVFAELGYTIPEKVRVSIGFTSKGERSRAIGECWSDLASKDGAFEIFIVPGMDDAARVAGVLTHELIHAAVGLEAGHGPVFAKAARALGLVGKMTATTEGPQWEAWAAPILKRLGALPHAALAGQSSGPKKQTTRLLKGACDVCGFTVRVTRSWACEEVDGQVVAKSLRCPDPACEGQLVVDLPDEEEPEAVPGA